MLRSIDISTSALVAQRVRMDTLASNLANVSTTHNEQGEPEPYQPRYVVFAADESVGPHGAAGVKVASVETSQLEPAMRYEPGHPDANADGYVAYPNVNMMIEMTDAMEAARAYEANLGAIEIAKDLGQQTLRILA
jgi:flagellar basal-body rod protein FlgC